MRKFAIFFLLVITSCSTTAPESVSPEMTVIPVDTTTPSVTPDIAAESEWTLESNGTLSRTSGEGLVTVTGLAIDRESGKCTYTGGDEPMECDPDSLVFGADGSITLTLADGTVVTTKDGKEWKAVAPKSELTSYLTDLDLKQTDILTDGFKYQGVDVGVATIKVDDSMTSRKVHEVGMTDSRLANTVMRAWWNLKYPDNNGSDAGLAEFAKTWLNVQSGKLPCSELAVTFEAFEVGGGSKRTFTVVPNCGKSPVPNGVMEMDLDLVSVNLSVADSETGSRVGDPKTPWMDLLNELGDQSGLMVDENSKRLMLFMDRGVFVSRNNEKVYVATSVEIALDWLRHFVVGEDWKIERTQTQLSRAMRWIAELTVE